MLMRKIASTSTDALYLIQEPYLYKNKIPGLPHTYCMFGSKESARAVILAPKHFHCVIGLAWLN